MSATAIGYERDAAGIVTLRWDDPSRKVNLLTDASIAELGAAIERVLADETVIGAILASGKRDFHAGLDLARVAHAGLDSVPATVDRFRALTRRMETGGKPFVALLNGSALGGGAELALGAHHRIAASDAPLARFGFPEVTLGLLPGGGGTQRVPRLCGIVAALPLLLEGSRLSFSEAHQLGLIDEIAPSAESFAIARAWILANRNAVARWDVRGFRLPGLAPGSAAYDDTFARTNALVRKQTAGLYPAPVAILSAVYEGTKLEIDRGLHVEGRFFAELANGREARAIVATRFFARGRANATNARPAGIPAAKFGHVGILGAGKMGAAIAQVTARAGMRVTLLDRDLETAERAATHARIAPSTDYDDLAGCDLVIEAVFEDRALKNAVTARAEAVVSGSTIVASNTSTLPITGLARASVRPENFIGLHFFSPVEKMPLVEIVRGERTSDATLASALDYVRAIEKTPLLVNDARGFFCTRVFTAYVYEGLAMLREGVPPALIENAGRLAGMAVGPLAVADEVHIGLLHAAIEQTRRDLGAAYVAGPADDVIALFATTLERSGKAAGRGFYAYPAGERKRLWERLAEAVGFPRDPNFDLQTIRDRLLYAQCAEARRAFAEGVLDDPTMGDLGSVLGWGFPAFSGGVFAFATYVGAGTYEERARELAARFGPRFASPTAPRP